MSSPSHPALSSLQDFIHEAFAQAVISADDAVSEAALNKFWAPHVQETYVDLELLPSDAPKCSLMNRHSEVATSAHFSLPGFRKVIQGLRTQLAERTFVKETFVIATPADPSNRTGAVGATHVFTAVQDGHAVTVTIVAVLRIKWVPEHGHHQGGRREVVTESYVINTSP
ncbi:hypothetical protein FB451DRAFT_1172692 [Mycena latifolia]|nr:hypothetical protein FB451DRAFT_1172692 [Mycena latifolia]